MKIQMPANVAVSVPTESRLLNKAQSVFVSSFKLRLSPDVNAQKYELSVLLATARSSPRYRSNAANYQFKLKSDSQGQYVTLKQQGWWSSFKGMLGWGREVREQQRTAARDLINSRLGIFTQPRDSEGADVVMKPNDRLNFANAKSYQVNVFEDTNLRRGDQGSNSEIPHMEDLMGELGGSSAYVRQEEEPAAAKSYEVIDQDPSGPTRAPMIESERSKAGNGGVAGEYALAPGQSVGIDEFNHLAGSHSSSPDKSSVGSIGSDNNKFLLNFMRDQLAQQLYGSPHLSGKDDELASQRSNSF
jgi:hypothetical protein